MLYELVSLLSCMHRKEFCSTCGMAPRFGRNDACMSVRMGDTTIVGCGQAVSREEYRLRRGHQQS